MRTLTLLFLLPFVISASVDHAYQELGRQQIAQAVASGAVVSAATGIIASLIDQPRGKPITRMFYAVYYGSIASALGFLMTSYTLRNHGLDGLAIALTTFILNFFPYAIASDTTIYVKKKFLTWYHLYKGNCDLKSNSTFNENNKI